MKHSWFKTVIPIAALFSFRMLGLFMLIPVFTVYASHLHSASPALIGVALGGYGLSQGLLQIPFGMLSDRLGRKPMIALGFALFIAGSLLGAVTESIYGMIAARILQGMGAIGSVLIALMADLTPDETRTRAMAAIGATIGLSFIVSMVISPAIAHFYGLSGIFYLSALLGVAGLLLLYGYIPTPTREPFHQDSGTNPGLLKSVIKNPDLLRLDFSIFCQHFILTATFFVLPLLLLHQVQTGQLAHAWYFYLPQMLFSFLLMLPFIILAEKKQQMQRIFGFAVFLTAVSQFLLAFTYHSWLAICFFAFTYFISFNILEASLPSLVSKKARPESKGTAIGIYSSCQFMGIFAGGVFAGLLFHVAGLGAVFIANGIFASLWLLMSFFMKLDNYRATLLIHMPQTDDSFNEQHITQSLKRLAGVIRCSYSPEERLLYLQIDKKSYERGSAEQVLKQLI